MISVYSEAVSRMRAKSAGGARPGNSGGRARPGVPGGRARPGVRVFGLSMGLVLVMGVVSGCGGGSAGPVSTAFHGAAAPSGSWPDPNGDLANTRDAPDAAIWAANVSGLR